VRNERARGEVAVFVLRGPGDDHLGRGVEPRLRKAAIERGGGFGRGLRHAGFLLQRQGEERVGARLHRPGLIREAAHPQAVEGEPRRFEHAEDLDRRRRSLRRLSRLEQRVAAKALQARERLLDGERARDPFELRKLAEHLVPFRLRLEFLAVERALAREACRLEQRREMPRPRRRALFRLFLQQKHGFQMLPQQLASPGRGHQPRKRHRGAERFAKIHVEPRAARHLGLGAAEERRADEPADARKFELAE
jgi:hypothetical protein